jgi:hypothetical protein
VIIPKKEKRAVGKKIESNRPDLRFSAIYSYDLAQDFHFQSELDVQ